MLFNPSWNKTTKVSLDDFIGWLETKNPREEYDYGNIMKCAMAQYMEARGIPVGKGLYGDTCERVFGRRGVDGRILHDDRRVPTFGLALRRAKKYKYKENGNVI